METNVNVAQTHRLQWTLHPIATPKSTEQQEKPVAPISRPKWDTSGAVMSRRRDRDPSPPPTLTELLRQWARSTTALQEQQGQLVERLSAAHITRDRLQPPTYDGSSSWEVFERQFTGAADVNGWPLAERGRRLLQVLRGQAADVVLSLPPEAYDDFPSLRARLSSHFGSARKGALAEAELERRCQNPGESLTDFAHAVRVLSRAAYSTWPEVAIEATARKAFINGLADPGLQRERARVARATMDDVVDEPAAGPSTSCSPQPSSVVEALNALRAVLQRPGPSRPAGSSGRGRRPSSSGPATSSSSSSGGLLPPPRLLPRVSWHVDGLVSGKPCRFVIDQGACLTVLKRGILPEDTEASTAVCLRNAHAAAPLGKLFGPRRVTLSLQRATVPVFVYEADINDDCLLGGDFIAAHVRTLDIDNDVMRLRVGDEAVQLTRQTAQPSAKELSFRVETVSRAVLQPGVSTLLPVTVRRCALWHPPGEQFLGGLTGPGGGEPGQARTGYCEPARTRARPTDPGVAGLATPPRREGCEWEVLAPLTVEEGATEESWTAVRSVVAELRPVQAARERAGVLVGTDLVVAPSNDLCVRVDNTSRRTVTLAEAACIGRLVLTTALPVNELRATPGELPEALEDLIKRSSAGLTAGEGEEVRKIVTEFQDTSSCRAASSRGSWRCSTTAPALADTWDTVSWRMKERYDLRAKRPNIQAGDRVWLYDPRRRVGFATKLGSWWTGPYVVLAAINDVCFRIRKLDQPRARPRVVHADRITPLVSMSRRAGSSEGPHLARPGRDFKHREAEAEAAAGPAGPPSRVHVMPKEACVDEALADTMPTLQLRVTVLPTRVVTLWGPGPSSKYGPKWPCAECMCFLRAGGGSCACAPPSGLPSGRRTKPMGTMWGTAVEAKGFTARGGGGGGSSPPKTGVDGGAGGSPMSGWRSRAARFTAPPPGTDGVPDAAAVASRSGDDGGSCGDGEVGADGEGDADGAAEEDVRGINTSSSSTAPAARSTSTVSLSASTRRNRMVEQRLGWHRRLGLNQLNQAEPQSQTMAERRPIPRESSLPDQHTSRDASPKHKTKKH
ncbi:Type III pantothenate kinase [Frankliniella fusca]|uniref:Type III pantothenate kinase n=1 Tax=Frankliniella fusca TaxID=407009 RepID=A0AAE1HKW2_9NEOP|nr:Type III pantothenate kinase [Frankliniella fusca]